MFRSSLELFDRKVVAREILEKIGSKYFPSGIGSPVGSLVVNPEEQQPNQNEKVKEPTTDRSKTTTNNVVRSGNTTYYTTTYNWS